MQKEGSFERFQILSGSMLKLIAMLSMLIDHAALILSPELAFMETPLFTMGDTAVTPYYILRQIGRLAFPIFCFLITEGFAHTKDVKKYGIRLLLFAGISEIPYNLMILGRPFSPLKQNIYFTLFLGVLLLYVFENAEGEIKKAGLMIAVAIVTVFLRVDYGLSGVLLILVLYALREHKAAQALVSYPLLSGGAAAFFAFLPINLYNGQRGFIRSGVLKYGFYLFYPVHILALLGIRWLLSR